MKRTTTSYAWQPGPAAPPSPLPSVSSLSSLQGRKGMGPPRQRCPAAAWRLRRSRSASSCPVWRAAATNADDARGALAAALPLLTLSDHSSPILASSLSRQR